MTHEELAEYLLAKPGAFVDYPFGNAVEVFKVGKKMFALIGFRDQQMNINLKCDPDEASDLRFLYPAISAGYHMNKKHWITVYFDGTVPNNEVFGMIDNSYHLVAKRKTTLSKRSTRA